MDWKTGKLRQRQCFRYDHNVNTTVSRTMVAKFGSFANLACAKSE